MLEEGFEIIEDLISENDIFTILHELEDIQFPFGVGGVRNVEKKIDSINTLISSPSLLNSAAAYLQEKPSCVRAILFNKTPESNWSVSWHQDKTVCVTKRFEKLGWGPWCIKDNVHHVQPPIDVLNKMVTFRIHLDASTKENGCLRVLPKSHENGVLAQSQIASYVKSQKPIECIAKRGSALVMRPHILHSSSRGASPSQRRVLHVEFSSYILPDGITWA
jgi:ectoine hydroxylase-related dioxygenase (phytanoyl-CoA dioxygenase family)